MFNYKKHTENIIQTLFRMTVAIRRDQRDAVLDANSAEYALQSIKITIQAIERLETKLLPIGELSSTELNQKP